MKCERCDNEATVHEVTIQGGKKVERHLCEACAIEAGVSSSPGAHVAQFLTQFIAKQQQQPGPPPSSRTSASCPTCGLSFAEFRSAGLLGCPSCYAAFEAQLGPLIERAHEGATHHVGKVPRRRAPEAAVGAAPPAGDPQGERLERERVLRRQLEAAVVAEQYELAAKLRDELARLGEIPVRGRGGSEGGPERGGEGVA